MEGGKSCPNPSSQRKLGPRAARATLGNANTLASRQGQAETLHPDRTALRPPGYFDDCLSMRKDGGANVQLFPKGKPRGGSAPLGGFGLGVKGGCWRASEVQRRAHPQPRYPPRRRPGAGGRGVSAQPVPLPLAGGVRGGRGATNGAHGTKRHPPTSRMAMNRRRSRRKRDRAPRLMARKPSGPDGPRPALEGENK
jgi:hypothetical protein